MRLHPAFFWLLAFAALVGATVGPARARGPAQEQVSFAGPAYQGFGELLTELGGDVKLDRVCVDPEVVKGEEHARLRAYLEDLSHVSPLSMNNRNCVLLTTMQNWGTELITNLRDILIDSSSTLRFTLEADAFNSRTLSVALRESYDGFTVDGVAAASGLGPEAIRDELKTLSGDHRLERRDFRWGHDFFKPTLVQYSLMFAFSMATQPVNRAALSPKNFGTNFVKPPGTNPWDPFVVQYVAHPYKDSISYQLAREKGADFFTSTLASLLGVAMWEWGFEGWYQRVDRVDVTAGLAGGVVLGEASYRIVKRMCKDGRLSKAEAAIAIALNPQRVTHPRTCPQ